MVVPLQAVRKTVTVNVPMTLLDPQAKFFEFLIHIPFLYNFPLLCNDKYGLIIPIVSYTEQWSYASNYATCFTAIRQVPPVHFTAEELMLIEVT